MPVVASGGAGRPEHLADAILEGKADAALAASIFHFGEYTIRETKRIMRERGVPVRAGVEGWRTAEVIDAERAAPGTRSRKGSEEADDGYDR